MAPTAMCPPSARRVAPVATSSPIRSGTAMATCRPRRSPSRWPTHRRATLSSSARMGVTAVFEAGLPARYGPRRRRAGGLIHWLPPARIRAPSRSPLSDGVSKVELGGHVLTVSDTPHTFTDATGRLTASFSYDAATGLGAINYSYTLLDNVLANSSSCELYGGGDRPGRRPLGGRRPGDRYC